MGFEPANPHKYGVFTDQIGVLKVGRKWANGHKFDQNRPNPSPKFPAFLKKAHIKVVKAHFSKPKSGRDFHPLSSFVRTIFNSSFSDKVSVSEQLADTNTA